MAQLPQWQSDQEAVACRQCAVAFSLWNRKHHCRCCGFIYCDTCAPNRDDRRLSKSPFRGERLCGRCFTDVCERWAALQARPSFAEAGGGDASRARGDSMASTFSAARRYGSFATTTHAGATTSGGPDGGSGSFTELGGIGGIRSGDAMGLDDASVGRGSIVEEGEEEGDEEDEEDGDSVGSLARAEAEAGAPAAAAAALTPASAPVSGRPHPASASSASTTRSPARHHHHAHASSGSGRERQGSIASVVSRTWETGSVVGISLLPDGGGGDRSIARLPGLRDGHGQGDPLARVRGGGGDAGSVVRGGGPASVAGPRHYRHSSGASVVSAATGVRRNVTGQMRYGSGASVAGGGGGGVGRSGGTIMGDAEDADLLMETAEAVQRQRALLEYQVHEMVRRGAAPAAVGTLLTAVRAHRADIEGLEAQNRELLETVKFLQQRGRGSAAASTPAGAPPAGASATAAGVHATAGHQCSACLRVSLAADAAGTAAGRTSASMLDSLSAAGVSLCASPAFHAEAADSYRHARSLKEEASRSAASRAGGADALRAPGAAVSAPSITAVDTGAELPGSCGALRVALLPSAPVDPAVDPSWGEEDSLRLYGTLVIVNDDAALVAAAAAAPCRCASVRTGLVVTHVGDDSVAGLPYSAVADLLAQGAAQSLTLVCHPLLTMQLQRDSLAAKVNQLLVAADASQLAATTQASAPAPGSGTAADAARTLRADAIALAKALRSALRSRQELSEEVTQLRSEVAALQLSNAALTDQLQHARDTLVGTSTGAGAKPLAAAKKWQSALLQAKALAAAGAASAAAAKQPASRRATTEMACQTDPAITGEIAVSPPPAAAPPTEELSSHSIVAAFQLAVGYQTADEKRRAAAAAARAAAAQRLQEQADAEAAYLSAPLDPLYPDRAVPVSLAANGSIVAVDGIPVTSPPRTSARDQIASIVQSTAGSAADVVRVISYMRRLASGSRDVQATVDALISDFRDRDEAASALREPTLKALGGLRMRLEALLKDVAPAAYLSVTITERTADMLASSAAHGSTTSAPQQHADDDLFGPLFPDAAAPKAPASSAAVAADSAAKPSGSSDAVAAAFRVTEAQLQVVPAARVLTRFAVQSADTALQTSDRRAAVVLRALMQRDAAINIAAAACNRVAELASESRQADGRLQAAVQSLRDAQEQIAALEALLQKNPDAAVHSGLPGSAAAPAAVAPAAAVSSAPVAAAGPVSTQAPLPGAPSTLAPLPPAPGSVGAALAEAAGGTPHRSSAHAVLISGIRTPNPAGALRPVDRGATDSAAVSGALPPRGVGPKVRVPIELTAPTLWARYKALHIRASLLAQAVANRTIDSSMSTARLQAVQDDGSRVRSELAHLARAARSAVALISGLEALAVAHAQATVMAGPAGARDTKKRGLFGRRGKRDDDRGAASAAAMEAELLSSAAVLEEVPRVVRAVLHAIRAADATIGGASLMQYDQDVLGSTSRGGKSPSGSRYHDAREEVPRAPVASVPLPVPAPAQPTVINDAPAAASASTTSDPPDGVREGPARGEPARSPALQAATSSPRKGPLASPRKTPAATPALSAAGGVGGAAMQPFDLQASAAPSPARRVSSNPFAMEDGVAALPGSATPRRDPAGLGSLATRQSAMGAPASPMTPSNLFGAAGNPFSRADPPVLALAAVSDEGVPTGAGASTSGGGARPAQPTLPAKPVGAPDEAPDSAAAIAAAAPVSGDGTKRKTKLLESIRRGVTLFKRGTPAGAAGAAGSGDGEGGDDAHDAASSIVLDFDAAHRALDTDNSSATLSCVLRKRSRPAVGLWTAWKQRHAEVRSGFFMYFKTEDDDEPRNFCAISELKTVTLVQGAATASAAGAADSVLELQVAGGKRFQLAFADEKERERWYAVLKAVAYLNAGIEVHVA